MSDIYHESPSPRVKKLQLERKAVFGPPPRAFQSSSIFSPRFCCLLPLFLRHKEAHAYRLESTSTDRHPRVCRIHFEYPPPRALPPSLPPRRETTDQLLPKNPVRFQTKRYPRKFHLPLSALSLLSRSQFGQVYLSACLPVCLSTCLSVCLSVCLSACLPACLSVSLRRSSPEVPEGLLVVRRWRLRGLLHDELPGLRPRYVQSRPRPAPFQLVLVHADPQLLQHLRVLLGR